MKIAHTVLLALTFFGPTMMISTSVQAQEYDCYAPEDDVQDAACTLLGRARLAYNSVNGLSANTEVNNAKRHARNIINGTDRLAKLLFNQGSDEAILAQLRSLQTFVYQLDASARDLKDLYPNDSKLFSNLTAVRTAYLNLEGLLLPVEE